MATVDAAVAEIVKALSDYDEEAREIIKKEIDRVAAELVEDLKRDSPDSGEARKKKYGKGWTQKTVYENTLEKRVKVYNKNAPSLTHLLERGHALRHGGRTVGSAGARPHIKANEEKAIESLESGITAALKSNRR